MIRPIKPITDAEAEIMKILWREGRPLSYKEIRTELETHAGRNKSTIQTMLRRLIDKGSVTTQEHYVTLYSAGISESEYIRSETPPFLKRVFGGSAKKLLAALCESGALTADDIAELRDYFKAGDGDGHAE